MDVQYVRSHTSKCSNIIKIEHSNFMRSLKGKSKWLIYVRHPELQSKCDNSFEIKQIDVSTNDKNV